MMKRTRGPTLWERRNAPPVKLPEPDSRVIASRPALAAEASRSNNRIDEYHAQCEWEAHIAAGRIKVT